MFNDKEEELSTGTILGSNHILKTNNSRVEIRSSNNVIYRIGRNSEFCLENTVEGIVPVFFGELLKMPLPSITSPHAGASGGKYRTSCYMSADAPVFCRNTGEKEDEFYALENELLIYEYDERGIKYNIVQLNSFEKCTMIYDNAKLMRQRYEVIDKQVICKEEIEYIYNKFINPVEWIY